MATNQKNTPEDTQIPDVKRVDDETEREPEGQVEAEVSEEPKAPAEEAPEEGKAELPEKYQGKSAEEIAKMHMEAEKKLTQTAQEKSEALKALEDIYQPEQEAPTPVENTGNDEAEALLRNVIREEVAPLREKLSKAEIRAEFAEMKAKYSDLGEYAESIGEVFKEMPFLKQQEGGLEKAYKIARSENLDNVVQKAQSAGKQEAETSRLEKETAQVETAAKAPKADEEAELYNNWQSETDPIKREELGSEYTRKFILGRK